MTLEEAITFVEDLVSLIPEKLKSKNLILLLPKAAQDVLADVQSHFPEHNINIDTQDDNS